MKGRRASRARALACQPDCWLGQASPVSVACLHCLIAGWSRPLTRLPGCCLTCLPAASDSHLLRFGRPPRARRARLLACCMTCLLEAYARSFLFRAEIPRAQGPASVRQGFGIFPQWCRARAPWPGGLACLLAEEGILAGVWAISQ